jgi:hypothetical protein
MKTSIKLVYKFKRKTSSNSTLLYSIVFFCATAILILTTSNSVLGQTVVGKITRPGLKPSSLGVYEKENKVWNISGSLKRTAY